MQHLEVSGAVRHIYIYMYIYIYIYIYIYVIRRLKVKLYVFSDIFMPEHCDGLLKRLKHVARFGQ